MSKTWEVFAQFSEPEAQRLMLKTLGSDARKKLFLIRIKHFKWRKGRGKFRNTLFLLSLRSCLTVGPLQLAIHVTQNRRAGEKKSHRDKSNKRHNFKL